MKKRGTKDRVIKVKPKNVSKPTTTVVKNHLCHEFQKNYFPLDIASQSDVCIICGYGMKYQRPNVKGQLAFHTCFAQICLECLQNALEKQFDAGLTKLFCPICLTDFTDSHRAQIHPDVNNKISENLTLSNLENVVNCKFCSNRYLFEHVSPDEVNKEYNGRNLTDEQIHCAAYNAVTCNECLISTCQHCGAVPYHLGETCEEHKWWVEGRVCRICGRAAEPKGEVALLNCGHPDCMNIANRMCDHIHACGHACVGLKGEEKHPPCPECTSGGSLCQHCDKELWGSLCLILECGHTIHLNCAFTIIKRSRLGPELMLPLCPAIGCGEFIKHPSLETLAESSIDYNEWLSMENDVDRIAKQRVIAEGIDFHPEVASKMSPFSKNGEKAALNWAKKKLRFMICKQHFRHVIYTSGRIDDPPLNGVSCPNCSHYLYPNCPTHGFNYMQFKCDYCCSVGVRRGKGSGEDNNGWLCEICYDMPGRADMASRAACKGNCRFTPHQKSRNEFYGRCQKCGCIKSVVRSKNFTNRSRPQSSVALPISKIATKK